jgi:hypothetical protein
MRRALGYLAPAERAASVPGHNYVGAEHILLGLLERPYGVATSPLGDWVSRRTRPVIGCSPNSIPPSHGSILARWQRSVSTSTKFALGWRKHSALARASSADWVNENRPARQAGSRIRG